MLEASDITVRYGPRVILDGVDFSARAGAVTAIVGPNGSGKTTLMRALTGEAAYHGRITLEGQDIAGAKVWDLAALRGVLPQATPLAFPFTVLEVVRIGLSRGVAAGQDGLIRQALARVGLSGFEGRYYQELSGGEQQRVQLARVLAQVWEPVEGGVPRWLFLDEPVSALDIGHQLQVMQIARDYADAGGGVVAVMHDLNLTAMFADQVALIGEGRILAQDVPGAVLRDDLLSRAYRCDVRVNRAPVDGTFILPHAAGMAAE
ncbi:heme ABC transporter ATP-binding protein [Rhodalgimonas zhirmunskyi]|uniref:Heme ABC transporter ATP-binding protein n=1 Tax=Rhodalgimonas zhirmunskyi TaxID=2964767 RepID=A0AAJ1X5B3_9RHOB|nr:heme ABC transporter ATP-binding protein [Rhodoalgimonas zhirmunskyi]MDQ2093384.1 heme ABC transporter ATP-binding protein [Rhodoalgimonas zhirmunskyi]